MEGNNKEGDTARTPALVWWVMLATLVALAPIWSVHYIPLGDYPIHLARSYVLSNYHNVALFQQKYLIISEPIPNIGEEILIPLFMRVTDVLTAGRIFISIVLILFTYGFYLLARVTTDRNRNIVLLAPFLFYCNQFFWGTLNYMLGLSLFFIAFAIWYRYHTSWRPGAWIVVFLLIPMLYLAHLAAYALMLGACGVVLVIDLWKARRITRAAVLSMIPLLPPLAMYAMFMRGTGHFGGIVWASAWEKVIALVPFLVHHMIIDALLTLLLIAAITIAVYYRRSVTIQTDLLCIAIVFFAFFLLCPRALYTSYGADVRFLVPAWIFGFLAIRLEHAALRYIFISTLVVMVTRNAFIMKDWSTDSGAIRSEVELLDRSIRSNSRVYTLWNGRSLMHDRDTKALQFVACYTTIDRQAFTPSLIARRGQQPLIWRDSQDGALPIDPIDTSVRWQDLTARYDYMYYLGDSTAYPLPLRELSQRVGNTTSSSLWKVIR